MKRPIDHNVFDRRVNNPCRPKKLTERDERNIIRAVHRLRISIGSFTAKRLTTEAGIPATTSMKAGVQGKVVQFFVAIAYKKGVICCDKYTQRLNGVFFASYIRNRFPSHFQASANPRAMRFLQDGDPSQNSTKAQRALQDVGALLFRIPARSPDLNPIENIFNIVSAKLERDALLKQIKHKTFEQFFDRVEKTLCNIDPKLIDRTTELMNKRI